MATMGTVDWSKIGRSSKSKGKYGERRCADLLMKFTGRNFRRVPCSGGYNKQGGVTIAEHKFCGDVICDEAGFIFSVEYKNRPDDFSLGALLTVPGSAPFTSWWYQTLFDAKLVDLLPLLMFKLGRASNAVVTNDFIAITDKTYAHLGLDASVPRMRPDIYSGPVTLKIKDKQAGKLVDKEIVVCLPPPIIISWKVLSQYAKPENFFIKPQWDIAQENSNLVIISERVI